MNAFRVGLIGYGLGGETFHAPLISTTPGLDLVAIVTGNTERVARAASAYPRVRIVPNVDALWRMSNELDLVVVSSPSGTHYENARAALDAGLSVVVDKPFAATSRDARDLIGRAAEPHRLIVPFHNRRWDGDFLTVRDLVAKGALGNVVRFESRFERWRVVPKARWMGANGAQIAEGMLYDLHTHLIDQALVLFGPVAHVYAEMDRRREGVQVDDETFLALTHVSGVRSHLGATLVAAQQAPRFRVYGTRATYVKDAVDPQEEMLKSGRRPGDDGFGEDPRGRWGTLGDGETVTSVPTLRGDYPRFYAGVVAALRGEAPPPVDPMDAVAGLEIIETALSHPRSSP